MTYLAMIISLFLYSAKMPTVKIGAHYEMCGYNGAPTTNATDARIIQFLDYYKKLGYTHVLYDLKSGSNAAGSFQRINSQWQYNNGNYTSGEIYRCYKAFYDAAKSRGLTVIPKINSLSHADAFINVDKSTWEFDDATWSTYASQNGITDISTPLRQVVNPVNNTSLNQIFAEYLKIIKAVQGTSLSYIHLGFDEPAWAELLLIMCDKSKTFNGSASKLIVTSLEDRIKQINTGLSTSTKVIIYGDGYLPGDQGSILEGISNDLYTNGSVLNLIKASSIASARTVIMPWGYELRDNQDIVPGSFRLNPPALHNKMKQLEYIDNIGLPYMIMMGEGSGQVAHIVRDASYEFIERQCTFEWYKTAQQYPKYFLGIAHATWSAGNSCNSNNLCVGYQAPIISYLGWYDNGSILDWVANNSYSPEIFNVISYKTSRNNFSWTKSTDYNSRQLLKGGR